MNAEQFIRTGIRLHGRNFWKARLARDLGVDVSTIHRMAKRAQIPGPVEIALKALVNNRIAQDKLEQEARKLLPKKARKRSPKNAAKRRAKTIQRHRARHPQPGSVQPDETNPQPKDETDAALP